MVLLALKSGCGINLSALVEVVMKAFILGLFVLVQTSSAFADEASIHIAKVSGRIIARNGLQIQAVTAKLGLSFCWGLCSSTPSNTKDLKIRTKIDETGTNVLFVNPQVDSYKEASLLGHFNYCSFVLEVMAKTPAGELVKGKASVATSKDRKVCGDVDQMTDLVSDSLHETLIVEIDPNSEGLSILPVSATAVGNRSIRCVDHSAQDSTISGTFQNFATSKMTVSLSIPTGETTAEVYKGKCAKSAGADELAYRCNVMTSTESGYEVILASNGTAKMQMVVRSLGNSPTHDPVIVPCY